MSLLLSMLTGGLRTDAANVFPAVGLDQSAALNELSGFAKRQSKAKQAVEVGSRPVSAPGTVMGEAIQANQRPATTAGASAFNAPASQQLGRKVTSEKLAAPQQEVRRTHCFSQK